MKKILLGLLVVGSITQSVAQEAADKKIQAGLVTGFGLNFQKMGTKLMSNDGPGTDLTIGANLIYSFNETIGFNTGVEFDFESLRYKAAASNNVYYWYNDAEILQQQDIDPNSDQLFQLTTRKQKPVYLTIPTMMIFRTKFIGYFRYFGKFGLRNSFLLKNEIYDNGANFEPEHPLGVETTASNDNMTAKGDMLFFKSAVGLVGGAEWNFVGSTCLVGELGFYYGFTPLHLDKNEGKTTLSTSGTNPQATDPSHFSNQATQTQLQLKVSILF